MPKIELIQGDCLEKMQNELFEWQGMPEFVQEKKAPFKVLTVRFETEQDYIEFQELIGQRLTVKTKSIWHPFKSHWGAEKKVWVSNES